MEDILKIIKESKISEVAASKRMLPDESLLAAIEVRGYRPRSMKKSIAASPCGIIAEHKRRSPSKGEISPMSNVAETVASYSANGAAAISVLTDTPFFGGSLTDLMTAREATETPLLRKDFIIDPYQILQARASGADAILLIASMIDAETAAMLADFAHDLELEVLLELHTKEEAQSHPIGKADMVGVNNRNLHNFTTSLESSLSIIDLLPEGTVKIAESGIKTPSDLIRLRAAGFDGFLIGETFMSTPSPGDELRRFVKAVAHQNITRKHDTQR